MFHIACYVPPCYRREDAGSVDDVYLYQPGTPRLLGPARLILDIAEVQCALVISFVV
jgi:hypothetical protein